MQPLGTKVDDHCVANTGGTEIAKRLSDVFGCDGLDGFQFYNEAVLHEEVSEGSLLEQCHPHRILAEASDTRQ